VNFKASNRIIQDIDLFRRGGRDTLGARESRVPSDITDQLRSEQRNRLIQDINLIRALSELPSSKDAWGLLKEWRQDFVAAKG
jgi:hypothetical protein